MRDLSLRQIGAMDMGSRRVLGFALGEHRDAALAFGALATAAAFRGHPGARRDRAHDQGSEPAKALLACQQLSVTSPRAGPGQRWITR